MKDTLDSCFSPLFDMGDLMSETGLPWAFCGGWAIDLFLGRLTRPHKDIDIAIFRRDQGRFHRHLRSKGWRMTVVRKGHCVPWLPGEKLFRPDHEIHAHNEEHALRKFELLLNEREDDLFLFRRNPQIRIPVADAILRTAQGMPLLAPEIVLLFKAGDPETPVIRQDMENLLPALKGLRIRQFLSMLSALDPKHPWLQQLVGE